MDSADIDNLRIRLSELKSLKKGWLDGTGLPPSDAAIRYCTGVLDRMVEEGAFPKRPRVFPTPEGGLQVEWEIGEMWSVELHFPQEGTQALVTAGTLYDMRADQREATFQSDELNATNVTPLVEFLSTLSPK